MCVTLNNSTALLNALEALLIASSASTITEVGVVTSKASPSDNGEPMNDRMISTMHDAASLALQQSLQTLNTLNYMLKTVNTSIGGPLELLSLQVQCLHLAVRACLALSQCWLHARCAYLLPRIEFMVGAGTYAAQLKSMLLKLDNSGAGGGLEKSERAAIYASIAQSLSENDAAVSILQSIYQCQQEGAISASVGTTESTAAATATSVAALAVMVKRDTSSTGYLRLLLAKALTNRKYLV